MFFCLIFMFFCLFFLLNLFNTQKYDPSPPPNCSKCQPVLSMARNFSSECSLTRMSSNQTPNIRTSTKQMVRIMAATQVCHHISVSLPLPRRLTIFRHHKNANIPATIFSIPQKHTHLSDNPLITLSTKGNLPKVKWVVRMSVAEESPPTPTVDDVERLVDFLYEDLPHLFDDRGIDRTAYDERVQFRDPITRHHTISGYLFNIATLKLLFKPKFKLHWVKKTGPYEITTRWTMVMKFILLPWKPELIFTGTSVMGINPETKKFCSHIDYWDSITNNSFFSIEGLLDVLKQLQIYKTPELESPKYKILKRTATYEVRKYDPFIVVETEGDKLSGSSGFNNVAGYIFGKNSTMEKIPMTTPVFTQALDAEKSNVSIQIVLPSKKDLDSLPAPDEETIKLRKVDGGVAAVSKFSGEAVEDIVIEKEKALRNDLIRDGLKSKIGCMLARYNDPGRTLSFIMRNEVLIWLEEFSLE